MKVPMKWLKEYTEINLPAAEYAEKMVMSGDGVEGIENTGELFDHELEAMKKPLVLIKPESGVSTAEAYRTFDGNPQKVDESAAAAAEAAQTACEVPLVNNLSPAAESVLPELADVRAWLHRQAGVEASLLCGSGSTTFAVCRDFNVACSIAAAAQSRGWWARTTMFGSLKAAIVPEQS